MKASTDRGRFAERVLHGVDSSGDPETVVIWIERKEGGVWSVGRAVNPDRRTSKEPRPEDYVFEGYELGDALQEANETLEDDVVELAAAPVVRADRADERAGTEPFATEYRVRGRGRRDHDVAQGRILVALSGLGAVLGAEGTQPVPGAAIRDDALDVRQRRADAEDLRLRLPAAADHAEARRPARGEVPGRDAARRTGAQLAQLVGLDDRDELGRGGAEEEDGEACALTEAGVDLRARVTELEVCGGHDGERTAVEPQAVPRPVLHGPRRHAAETRFDRLDRVRRCQQLRDVRLGQIERHRVILAATSARSVGVR